MNEPLGPDELASILRREYDAADHYYEQIEPLMEAAFRYYEAQPFGNEVDGRSQIVLPDVQETCDYMQQSVLRTFLSGDRTIEFEATDEEDEQAADDATAAIDYRFMREQDGARVLGDVLQDGNLKMLGVFKALCEYDEKVSRRWEVIPIEALGILPETDGMEIEQVREGQDPETGESIARVRIKTQQQTKTHKLVAVPLREFRFSEAAKHEDEAGYLAHVRKVNRSELVAMGFDPDQVYSLPTHYKWQDTESDTRDYHTGDVSSEALEEVLLCEEYARIDVDGDGIAERVKSFRVENEILRWAATGEGEEGELAVETVDEQPFAVYCPFPRPHRLVGYALAHKVMDIQLARSEVARQMFDGMAYANMPRMIVDEQLSADETMDDVLNPIPGSPIRGRAGAVTPVPSNFSISDSLNAMQWMTGERESRTGITRMNQGLDADTLNKTATGTALMQSAGQQFEEAIAYQLASAFARGCAKLYRMMRVEADPFTIKVDGKYRQVDPSTWPETVNLRIRVGLGTNSKDKRIQARMALLQPLTLAMEQGMAGPEHAFNWFDGVARDTGIGHGDDFLYDPSDPEVQARNAQKEQQPDPALVEAQGKLELEREKAGASAALDRDKAQAAIETDREKHAMQMQAMREKAALDNQLARDKAAAEIELSRERMAAEIQLQRERNAREADLQQNRMGGDLDK